MMKAYGTEQCVPFEYAFWPKGSTGKEYEDSGEEEVLEEACTESELGLGNPVDEDRSKQNMKTVLIV